MEAVCGQMQAFTAQLASITSAKRHKAKAGAGAYDPGGSSDDSGSSGDPDRDKGKQDSGDSSDDEQIVRQGKDSRAKARVVRSLAGSSSSSSAEDKGIVGRI